ncbi:hypothetical protein [Almyronema epifaneia]|uniref:Uncharacterized protein n=1 Tax=Almyronema epifaneia S1 TaxID=2991925 RepID=A0ABW6IC09_9CYAN
MIVDRVPGDYQSASSHPPERMLLELQEAQQTIYDFLLKIVKTWPASQVLEEFKRLFIQHSDTTNAETLPSLYAIVFANNEQEFCNTLKRSCYILINNWEVKREHQAIQDLIGLFEDPVLQRHTFSPTLKRLRNWLRRFVVSEDFQTIRLFAFRLHEESREEQWSTRYASYLLVPQYVDTQNPIEQREAARVLSRRLKEKFKFELALYTAHSQSASPISKRLKNPTALGEGVLRLIKAIVARRGRYSYRNLAHLFLQQTRELRYRSFKKSLVNYLIFSVDQPDFVKTLKAQLSQKLDQLHTDYNDNPLDSSLILRTCNRTIDYLTTEDKSTPSMLFTMLLSQGSSLTLAIVLLKLILVSKSSHAYLEVRIAELIRYYEQFPRDQCRWIINFLEVFSVTFAIYAENIEYNLIQVDENGKIQPSASFSRRVNLDACRIFSQAIRQPELAEGTQAEDEAGPEVNL